MTGLSQRQLRYLEQHGLVTPAVRKRAGRGITALYAPADVVRLMVIERMRAVCGGDVGRQRLRLVVDALQRRAPAPSQRLVLDPHSCWVQDSVVDAALRRSTCALVVELDAIAEEAQLRLRRAGVSR